MQCDVDHPCQTLADLMTIREQRGRDLRGLKIAVSWAYAPSYAKPLSVPQGLIMLMPRFGMDVVLAHPPEYGLMPETVRGGARECPARRRQTSAWWTAWTRLSATPTWSSPRAGAASTPWAPIPAESLRIAKQYTGWICDAERMKLARPDVLYMHPLPADRGNEVTDEVIDGPNSVVYQEAENRLHTAKAIMALTMADRRNRIRARSGMPETLVIALGGNAITRPGEPGTIPQQFAHTAETLGHLMPLFRSDAESSITHGNGPQIGNILIRVEEGERRVPRLPLDTCVSDSQGGMGYMIQRIACELFRREGIAAAPPPSSPRCWSSEDDPDMAHPTQAHRLVLRRRRGGARSREKPHWDLARNRAGPVPARGGVAAPDCASWKRRPSPGWWRRAWSRSPAAAAESRWPGKATGWWAWKE